MPYLGHVRTVDCTDRNLVLTYYHQWISIGICIKVQLTRVSIMKIEEIVERMQEETTTSLKEWWFEHITCIVRH